MMEPRPGWMPPIPGPLQRLFDLFPLVTYPANELPSRSPGPSNLPTLYVFASEEGARKGSPSFNPTCLKWQTFLKIAGVQFRIVPSTNHASPTGALPFLLPPNPSPPPSTQPPSSSSSSSSAPRPPQLPIPSTSLPKYALTHGLTPSPPSPPHPRQQAYQSLLDGPLRSAWLHALYLTPSNTPLLRTLYAHPATTSTPIQSLLLHHLRRAAAAELPSHHQDRPDDLYSEAASALSALAALLADSGTGWFFGRAAPGEFDAAVFAYTQLLLGGGLAWVDRRLADLARDAGEGELVGHRGRIWDLYWGEDGGEGENEG
ncbi:hypothetical protein QBC33DRAFT_597384 [Phialemonium atrogriseum]|uniref:Thioredoxin-like fold domain-containing protein n=1 Tax=Phialemonium atrogriseum TaxID=1093897 RepID=A0AAJ0C6H6_9PEZI|nr:uncharacterized protein QBC33DRAFT_597384 [Phialemonium atrogriseum]KAK1770875.1 hypothetical protein QBC33DRAFT_597384 [Phialemonium atrogriseum]